AGRAGESRRAAGSRRSGRRRPKGGKAVRRSLILVNVALVAAVILLAYTLVGQWRQFEARHRPDLSSSGARAESGGSDGSALPASASGFAAIVDHHLFALDRNNDLPEGLSDEPPEAFRPLPVLMGTMGLGGEEVALMVSGSPGNSGGLYRRLKVGEALDGYTLVRIDMDRVVMKTGAREVVVGMDDRTRKPSRRARTARPVEGNRSQTTGVGSGTRRAGASRRRSARTQRQRADDLRNVPVGTVRDGRRLIEEQTPFGAIKVWVEQKSK
ncbi:MAG: hypothetical protein OXH11_15295, partial [Candidatus Aminicenantes bacterium]|nr:hypothetical protein [Candidatus Aminicenantes bacterium]